MREHRSRRPSEAVGSAIEQGAGAEKHVQSAQVLMCLRGRNGGVSLARSPESIGVEEALRAAEDNFDLVECSGGAKNHCVISGACELSGVLDNALAAFFDVLGKASLADLVKNRKVIERSLLPWPKTTRVTFHPRAIKPARTRSKAI